MWLLALLLLCVAAGGAEGGALAAEFDSAAEVVVPLHATGATFLGTSDVALASAGLIAGSLAVEGIDPEERTLVLHAMATCEPVAKAFTVVNRGVDHEVLYAIEVAGRPDQGLFADEAQWPGTISFVHPKAGAERGPVPIAPGERVSITVLFVAPVAGVQTRANIVIDTSAGQLEVEVVGTAEKSKLRVGGADLGMVDITSPPPAGRPVKVYNPYPFPLAVQGMEASTVNLGVMLGGEGGAQAERVIQPNQRTTIAFLSAASPVVGLLKATLKVELGAVCVPGRDHQKCDALYERGITLVIPVRGYFADRDVVCFVDPDRDHADRDLGNLSFGYHTQKTPGSPRNVYVYHRRPAPLILESAMLEPPRAETLWTTINPDVPGGRAVLAGALQLAPQEEGELHSDFVLRFRGGQTCYFHVGVTFAFGEIRYASQNASLALPPPGEREHAGFPYAVKSTLSLYNMFRTPLAIKHVRIGSQYIGARLLNDWGDRAVGDGAIAQVELTGYFYTETHVGLHDLEVVTNITTFRIPVSMHHHAPLVKDAGALTGVIELESTPRCADPQAEECDRLIQVTVANPTPHTLDLDSLFTFRVPSFTADNATDEAKDGTALARSRAKPTALLPLPAEKVLVRWLQGTIAPFKTKQVSIRFSTFGAYPPLPDGGDLPADHPDLLRGYRLDLRYRALREGKDAGKREKKQGKKRKGGKGTGKDHEEGKQERDPMQTMTFMIQYREIAAPKQPSDQADRRPSVVLNTMGSGAVDLEHGMDFPLSVLRATSSHRRIVLIVPVNCTLLEPFTNYKLPLNMKSFRQIQKQHDIMPDDVEDLRLAVSLHLVTYILRAAHPRAGKNHVYNFDTPVQITANFPPVAPEAIEYEGAYADVELEFYVPVQNFLPQFFNLSLAKIHPGVNESIPLGRDEHWAFRDGAVLYKNVPARGEHRLGPVVFKVPSDSGYQYDEGERICHSVAVVCDLGWDYVQLCTTFRTGAPPAAPLAVRVKDREQMRESPHMKPPAKGPILVSPGGPGAFDIPEFKEARRLESQRRAEGGDRSPRLTFFTERSAVADHPGALQLRVQGRLDTLLDAWRDALDWVPNPLHNLLATYLARAVYWLLHRDSTVRLLVMNSGAQAIEVLVLPLHVWPSNARAPTLQEGAADLMTTAMPTEAYGVVELGYEPRAWLSRNESLLICVREAPVFRNGFYLLQRPTEFREWSRARCVEPGVEFDMLVPARVRDGEDASRGAAWVAVAVAMATCAMWAAYAAFLEVAPEVAAEQQARRQRRMSKGSLLKRMDEVQATIRECEQALEKQDLSKVKEALELLERHKQQQVGMDGLFPALSDNAMKATEAKQDAKAAKAVKAQKKKEEKERVERERVEREKAAAKERAAKAKLEKEQAAKDKAAREKEEKDRAKAKAKEQQAAKAAAKAAAALKVAEAAAKKAEEAAAEERKNTPPLTGDEEVAMEGLAEGEEQAVEVEEEGVDVSEEGPGSRDDADAPASEGGVEEAAAVVDDTPPRSSPPDDGESDATPTPTPSPAVPPTDVLRRMRPKVSPPPLPTTPPSPPPPQAEDPAPPSSDSATESCPDLDSASVETAKDTEQAQLLQMLQAQQKQLDAIQRQYRDRVTASEMQALIAQEGNERQVLHLDETNAWHLVAVQYEREHAAGLQREEQSGKLADSIHETPLLDIPRETTSKDAAAEDTDMTLLSGFGKLFEGGGAPAGVGDEPSPFDTSGAYSGAGDDDGPQSDWLASLNSAFASEAPPPQGVPPFQTVMANLYEPPQTDDGADHLHDLIQSLITDQGGGMSPPSPPTPPVPPMCPPQYAPLPVASSPTTPSLTPPMLWGAPNPAAASAQAPVHNWMSDRMTSGGSGRSEDVGQQGAQFLPSSQYAAGAPHVAQPHGYKGGGKRQGQGGRGGGAHQPGRGGGGHEGGGRGGRGNKWVPKWRERQ